MQEKKYIGNKEKLRRANQKIVYLLKENKKKDKIIDLIARSWKQDDIRSVEEIKQHFEKKVEESNAK